MKISPATLALAVVLAPLCLFENSAVSQSIDIASSGGRIGMPYDWSHRHVVFSNPETSDRLAGIMQDARYWQQVYRRFYGKAIPRIPPVHLRSGRGSTKVDWAESVGSNLNFMNVESFPAKYSFNIANPNPDCANDYVVYEFPIGNANNINLMAFNNLYVNNSGSGICAGTTPSVLFAYNASVNNGPLSTSPVLSLDGTQVAFIENTSRALFNVVKWKAGEVNTTTFGKPYNSSHLPNCATNGAVAPCEYSVQYSTKSASLSSPYVDYASDTAYVTDDAGEVASITPVFKGGQPVATVLANLAGNQIMTSPVYDSVSKNVFAADAKGNLYYVRTSSSSLGTCASGTATPCTGNATLNVAGNKAIIDGPLIDSSSGKVFVFSSSSPDGKSSSVVQTTTTLSGSVVADVGPNGNQNGYSGTFNNAYYNNPSTGLLYACGTDAKNVPALFALSFTGTTMKATPAYGPLSLAAKATFCSPLTEVFNQSSSKDELYLSVGVNCTSTIMGGCVEFFDITNGFPSATALTPVAETGGTGGIIVDNVSGNVNATNIYFVTQNTQTCTLYTGGTDNKSNCAVKLTQTTLQ